MPLPIIRQPGLAVFDLDSTLIELESIDAIAQLGGRASEVAELTERAMLGELAFGEALQQRIAMLKGIPEQPILELAERLPYIPGADVLVSFLKEHRWRIAIASGGFTWFADQASLHFGADFVVCNALEVREGKLTGKLLGRLVDGEVKRQTLVNLAEQYRLPRSQTLAIGDGANDLPMMAAAGCSIAVNAKPKVQAAAEYSITGDLSQVVDLLFRRR